MKLWLHLKIHKKRIWCVRKTHHECYYRKAMEKVKNKKKVNNFFKVKKIKKLFAFKGAKNKKESLNDGKTINEDKGSDEVKRTEKSNILSIFADNLEKKQPKNILNQNRTLNISEEKNECTNIPEDDSAKQPEEDVTYLAVGSSIFQNPPKLRLNDDLVADMYFGTSPSHFQSAHIYDPCMKPHYADKSFLSRQIKKLNKN